MITSCPLFNKNRRFFVLLPPSFSFPPPVIQNFVLVPIYLPACFILKKNLENYILPFFYEQLKNWKNCNVQLIHEALWFLLDYANIPYKHEVSSEVFFILHKLCEFLNRFGTSFEKEIYQEVVVMLFN